MDAVLKIPLVMIDEIEKSIDTNFIAQGTSSLFFYQNCQILNIFSQKNSSKAIMKDHTEIINTETGNLLIFSWLHFFICQTGR